MKIDIYFIHLQDYLYNARNYNAYIILIADYFQTLLHKLQ